MATPIPTNTNTITIYGGMQPGEIIPPTVINAYSALTIPPYWRAVNFLANNLASFPRSVHRDGAKAEGHYLAPIIKRRPNAYQNSTQHWRTWFFHAAHHGNGYSRIERTPTGTVRALHNLLTCDVQPFRYDRDDGNGIQQYYYHRPSKQIYPAADILALCALSYDGMVGMDPVEFMADSFQRAKTLDRYQTKYLQKGTVIRGAVEIPQGVTLEQTDQLVATIRTFFSGPNAERDVIVLSDGAKLNNSTISPQESQIIEQGASVTKAISQITGVPPQFLYEFSESKYNNSIEQMGQDVVRNCLRPWIEQAEDELALKLLSTQELDGGYTVKLNPDALLRGDTQTQTTTILATVNGGLRTRNEGRALLDLPPDPSPDSDKLKTLGDTTPTPSTPQPPARSSAEQRAAVSFTALQPVIDAAVARVEAKTSKAFDNHADKPAAQRTIWSNVFAGEQSSYVAEALGPVAVVLKTLTGRDLDAAAIGERYGVQVRRKAATAEPTDLAGLIAAALGG